MNDGPGRLRAMVARWDLGSSPVLAGRALLLLTGLVVCVSVSALRPSASDWRVIATVSAAMFLVLGLSFVVPWSRLPDIMTMFFPVAAIAGIACLGGFSTADIGSSYTGLFVFCFAYVGLYHPIHSAWPLAVLAAPAFVATVDRWDVFIQIRLVIGTAIWVILAEVMAVLTQSQKRTASLLEQAARTDGLTGLGTRRDLDLRIAAVSPGDTVVICDLDHFKQVNDTQGHARGDEVLREFGTVVRGCLRGDDYAGRYGGEEFVLVLADTDDLECEKVLKRLQRKWADTGQGVTFSAGYRLQQRGDRPADTLAAADGALYEAKAAGRNRAVQAHRPTSWVAAG